MASTEHLEPYKWKKGESGNKRGRPKAKTLPEYAREYLEEIDPETGLPRIVSVSKNWVDESLVSPALFLSLLDRLYGKVPNAVSVQNDGQLRVIIEHVGDAGSTD